MGESENHGRRAFFIQAAVSPPGVLFGCDDSIKAGVKYLDGEFDLTEFHMKHRMVNLKDPSQTPRSAKSYQICKSPTIDLSRTFQSSPKQKLNSS